MYQTQTAVTPVSPATARRVVFTLVGGFFGLVFLITAWVQSQPAPTAASVYESQRQLECMKVREGFAERTAGARALCGDLLNRR